MVSPNISTYHEIEPLMYSWSTPDIPKYQGWEKIGYTQQTSTDQRIAQQASQLGISKHKNWARKALFTDEIRHDHFTDHQFHAYLQANCVPRELEPKRTEWFNFNGTQKTSLEYFTDYAGGEDCDAHSEIHEDYELRAEQQAAVDQALAAFDEGYHDVLWNAKPRFGKTLTTYDLMRQLDARRVLIITNRPAIANSWFDDFTRFIGYQTTYQFVSDSSSLKDRYPMPRENWPRYLREHRDDDPRIIEFVSLQDLKGSRYFGGDFDKLKHISECDWDLLVVDEAHEGVDTDKTDIAFDQINRKHTLYLSGTPFKALASGAFEPEQIFNWTYQDERIARDSWLDPTQDNPYEPLPQLNMYTYQVSRMISDQLAQGAAIEDGEDDADTDFAFDLGQFFATKDNGFFVHEAEVGKFLDCLAENEKYPFSTPELRDEIRHSFWLLDRVASAKALKRMLEHHATFKDYKIILAAGKIADNPDDGDLEATTASLDRVKKAIKSAEQHNGKTITLSVGQLTTGVTVPEWTAVLMFSNVASPERYMQTAFRAQNPCEFERGGRVFEKQNAYIFDFAPERTLEAFDKFANNLSPRPVSNPSARTENIRTLLNFFPIIGEDSDGTMIQLDAEQVLTFPQAIKAREVVRRGFLSNLLFENVSNIFHAPNEVREILEKLPVAKQGRVVGGQDINLPVPLPAVDKQGIAHADETIIINKTAGLGKPVWREEDVLPSNPNEPDAKIAGEIAKTVLDKTQDSRAQLKQEYGLTKKQMEHFERQAKQRVTSQIERRLSERRIEEQRLNNRRDSVATEAEATSLNNESAQADEQFKHDILDIASKASEDIPEQIIRHEEDRKEQKRANSAMEDIRSHLRGFARTIPMFLMAYGSHDTKLDNFETTIADDMFAEITGISKNEFRVLRDGPQVPEDDGTMKQLPGFFDEAVFNQSVQEFLDKKEALSDYFDPNIKENIFAYIPQQKTSLVFTPQTVVKDMVDTLAQENPGIFENPKVTFIDPFSTAGLFLMELVRRLDAGLASLIPDRDERLRYILTSQLFEMSHNQILHDITIEAVSGGVETRKAWMRESGHYQVGDVSTEEGCQAALDMLNEGSQS